MFVAENYFWETMCEAKDIFLFKALGLDRTKMVTWFPNTDAQRTIKEKQVTSDKYPYFWVIGGW